MTANPEQRSGGFSTGPRPLTWRCGSFEHALDRPLVMGILNVTPDSFSDGGEHFSPEVALQFGTAMLAAGADIIDVGGESTRPGAEEVSIEEELGRVLRPVRAFAAQGASVSIDTRHPEVASACAQAGASILNDVSGFRDAAMIEVAATTGAGVIVMHMRGEPRTMQENPRYDDVVGEVAEYLVGQAALLESAGVARERIAVDPGIGFGKTTAHNLKLIRQLPRLVALGYPVVLGASRKRFLGEITGVADPRERLGGSIAAALAGAERGAHVLRVHDVANTVQALRVMGAVEGAAPE